MLQLSFVYTMELIQMCVGLDSVIGYKHRTLLQRHLQSGVFRENCD